MVFCFTCVIHLDKSYNNLDTLNLYDYKKGVKTIILRVLLQASFLLHSSKEKYYDCYQKSNYNDVNQ